MIDPLLSYGAARLVMHLGLTKEDADGTLYLLPLEDPADFMILFRAILDKYPGVDVAFFRREDGRYSATMRWMRAYLPLEVEEATYSTPEGAFILAAVKLTGCMND